MRFNNAYIYPLGYADLGRLPFTIWGDVFAEWALKIGGRYTIAVNAQINNVLDCRTWQQYQYDIIRNTMAIDDQYVLNGEAVNPNTTVVDSLGHSVYWRDRIQYYRPNVAFTGDPNSQYKYQQQFGRRSLRLGARFSF
jgi:hypothetical protein